jgi:spore coat protein H
MSSHVLGILWTSVFHSVGGVAVSAWLGLAVAMGFGWGAPALRADFDKVSKHERRAAADTLFTNSTVLRLRIDISRASANSLRRNPREPVPATVREEGVVYTNVLLHLKGHWGSFRGFDDKPGLTLKIDETNTLFHGLKKFHLNNSIQDSTYLSEWVCGEMFDLAGVPFPRTAHAVVELNGRRLGMYVLKEGENRDFLTRYFKDTHGNLYGQSTFADVDSPLEIMNNNENDTARKDLRRLAAAAREGAPNRIREKLPLALDIPRFLSFMAMEMLLCDWDGYTRKIHNYHIYHNLDDNKMVFIPHDKDQMLRDPKEPIIPNPAAGMVADAIMRVPEFRQQYLDRLSEVFTNVFKAPDWNQRIEEKAQKLAASVESYDPAIARTMRANSRSIRARVLRRTASVAHLLQIPGGSGPPLPFENNIAKLKDWYALNDVDGANVARAQDAEGKTCLSIEANGKCTGSWRTKVSVEPGHYVFEGMARCAGVEPITDVKRGAGAGLRISGITRPRLNQLVGDSPWRKVAFEFRVADSSEDVILVCELLANAGQVWFDEDSLRLRKLE